MSIKIQGTGSRSINQLKVVGNCSYIRFGKEFLIGTVLYITKSLDDTEPNTNPKTNPNPNTYPIQLFYAFFSNTVR